MLFPVDLRHGLHPLIFPNGNEFHLRCHQAFPRIMHLRHIGPGFGPTRTLNVLKAELLKFRVSLATLTIEGTWAFKLLRVLTLINPGRP